MNNRIVMHVTDRQITNIINVINKHDIEIEEGNEPLTLEEVKNNKELLDYLFSDSDAGFDPVEVYRDDGFCDFAQYRK